MSNMRNLAKETLDILAKYGKSKDDRILVSDGGDYCLLPEFLQRADFEYDCSYGGTNINTELKVVGDDWWLERGEYDGAEWWEFKKTPEIAYKEGKPWISSLEAQPCTK